MNRKALLCVVLVVALAALGVMLGDLWPRLSGGSPGAAAASEDDTLVLRYGDPDAAHQVREGETFASIARERLGDVTHADELARLNGMLASDALVVGQVLRLR